MGRHRARLAMLAAAGIIASCLSIGLAGPAMAGGVKPASETPPTPTILPMTFPNSTPYAMVVDDTHGHVFISGGDDVVVTDMTGKIVKTITGEDGAAGLVLDEASGSLYVALSGANAVDRIDLTSLAETKRYPIGDTLCPTDIALDGSTMWFGCGNVSIGEIGSLNLSDGTVSVTPMSSMGPMVLVPGQHKLLIETSSDLMLVDISSGTPTVTKTASYTNGFGTTSPISLTPDGNDVCAVANLYSTTDLSSQAGFCGVWNNAAPAYRDGWIAYAGDVANSTTPGLFLQQVGSSTPFRSWLTGSEVHQIAWSSSGTLFAVSRYGGSGSNQTMALFTIPNATTAASTLTATAVANPYSGAVTINGALGVSGETYDGTVRAIHVSRTDRTGTHQLSDVSTDATGAYVIHDTSAPTGRLTYAVTFAGDSALAPASVTTHSLRQRPYDVNGDGFADLTVGSPLEDVGSVKNAGSFYELFSHASGVTGTGSVDYTQGTTGVPGTVETNDQLGYSQASGDFNGDGYADVAVSSNAEAVGSVKAAGTVTVFYGSASGLKTTGVKLLQSPKVTANSFFGETMAMGDFNGDGYADLAISQSTTGDVYVSLGGPSGLSSTMSDYRKSTAGVPGSDQKDELFGFSLAAGDINGDGRDDLAVGAPFDYDLDNFSIGAATILYGSATGLTGTGAQRFGEGQSGVPGLPSEFNKDRPDDFGWQVELADFNGDGHADLAVSAPGAPVTDTSKHEDAGTVTILYSSGTKIGTTNATLVTQATAGMPGNPGTNDAMGNTMATGDSNGDGYADLAIYSPGDYYVTIVKGGASGLSYGTAVAFTENSTGIAGSDHSGDDWGGSLRFESFKGAGPQGLAVGADGTSSGKGSVTVLYSSTSGLTGTGSTYLDQDSSGVPGTAEAGDAMGSFFSS